MFFGSLFNSKSANNLFTDQRIKTFLQKSFFLKKHSNLLIMITLLFSFSSTLLYPMRRQSAKDISSAMKAMTNYFSPSIKQKADEPAIQKAQEERKNIKEQVQGKAQKEEGAQSSEKFNTQPQEKTRASEGTPTSPEKQTFTAWEKITGKESLAKKKEKDEKLTTDAVEKVAEMLAKDKEIWINGQKASEEEAVAYVKSLQERGYEVIVDADGTVSATKGQSKFAEKLGTAKKSDSGLSLKDKASEMSAFVKEAPGKKKSFIARIQGKLEGKSYMDALMTGLSSRTDEMNERADKALKKIQKYGGESSQEKAFRDGLEVLKKSEASFFKDLAKNDPEKSRKSLEFRDTLLQKDIDKITEKIKTAQAEQKQQLLIEKKLLENALEKNRLLSQIAAGRVDLISLPFTQKPLGFQKPEFLIKKQFEKEAQNSEEQLKIMKKTRTLQQDRPPITQKEVVAIEDIIKNLKVRAVDVKTSTKERAEIERRIKELDGALDEALKRVQEVKGLEEVKKITNPNQQGEAEVATEKNDAGNSSPASRASEALPDDKIGDVTLELRKQNNKNRLQETIQEIDRLENKKKNQEKEFSPKDQVQLTKLVKKREKLKANQEKLSKLTSETFSPQINSEVARRQGSIRKSMYGYLNLQSGNTWSQKKRIGIASVVVGLGLVGTLIAIMASLDPLDTPDVGQAYGGGVFDGPKTGPGLADTTGALGSATFKNDAGYIVSGNFSNAQLAPTTGAAAPSGSTAEVPLSPEEIIQKTVADISTNKSFGRVLSHGEQEEIIRLLTQMQQDAASLQVLKTAKQQAKQSLREEDASSSSSSREKNQADQSPAEKKYVLQDDLQKDGELSDDEKSLLLTPSEYARLKSYKQTIRQLTGDLFMKELSIRYGKDDGSLVNNYDYRTTVADLTGQQAGVAQELTRIMPKINVLRNALSDQKYAQNDQKQKEITQGIDALKKQQEVAEGKQVNIANEILYLNLQRKRLANEITPDDVIKTLRTTRSFVRDVREPYASSKNRRLSSVIAEQNATESAAQSSVPESERSISYAVITRR